MQVEAYEVSRAKSLLRIIEMDMSEFAVAVDTIEQMKLIPTVAKDLRDRFRTLCLSKISK